MNDATQRLIEALSEKYEVVKRLKKGDVTAVYLCREQKGGALFAVKALWAGNVPFYEKDLAAESFEREVKVLRTLRHRCIPLFFESFSSGSWHYYVMEYIEGKTLSEIKNERGKPLEVDDAISSASKICGVLHFLHNRATPIIFRNLDPTNVFSTREGEIKLIDFGLVRFFDASKKQDTLVMGTFGYAAPEQYGGKQTTPKSDIYALGTTLYSLLTMEDPGQFLFNFPPIRKFNRLVPPWLEKIISRCLEREPEKRPSDAISLKRELDTGFTKDGGVSF
ncbi:MAG: serine/threonine-protein kinase [Candidatus Eremiobacteraeota bacterium]|nr:serine/threonine-protein kinase [Candidatus Eremiobacteraeota bacterium]